MVSVDVSCASCSEVSSRDILKALRMLARKGRYLCEACELSSAGEALAVAVPGGDEGDAGASLVIVSDDREGVLGRVSRGIFEAVYRKGFLVRDATHACWRISEHGIRFLKRSMSRCDGTSVSGPSVRTSAELAPRQRVQRDYDEDSPLAWLRARKDRYGQALITQGQYDAGERLRADFYAGSLNERVTMNWSGFHVRAGQGSGFQDRELSLSEAALAARERVRRAMRDVGPELSGVLIDVCCFGKKLTVFEREHSFPQRAGKVVLCLGLSALARHYGIGRAKGDGGRERGGSVKRNGGAHEAGC